MAQNDSSNEAPNTPDQGATVDVANDTDSVPATSVEETERLKRELADLQSRMFLKDTQIKSLEGKLREFEAKTSEIRDYVKKMESEVALVKERSEREAERQVFQKFSSLAQSILPVMDNFERSLMAAKDEKSALAEGVRMIHQQLLDGLKAIGISRIEAKGGKFDPNLHQAISTVRVDKKYDDDVVVQEVQAGFTFKDQLLRPAQVIVGKYGEDL